MQRGENAHASLDPAFWLGGWMAPLMRERSLASPSLTLAALGPSLPRGERVKKQRCRT